MLLTLRVTNFAVMEEVEVSFEAGLTVLTGETGAGKSMLIDALGLLGGGRAELEIVRTGADEASVEGLFERTALLGSRLEALGLPDLGAEVCIRRTVGRQGRGRVHINGALVTVGVLQKLMRGLIDIAGQHEHVALLDATQHLALVDRFGDLRGEGGPAARFDAKWAQLKALDQQLAALGGDDAQLQSRREFVAFQLDELEKLNLVPGEESSLEADRRRLAGSQKLRLSATQIDAWVASADGSALELVGRAVQHAADAEKVDAGWAPITRALRAAHAELDDASRSVSRYVASLDSDPHRLAEVEDRLDALKRNCRKHACTVEGLIAKREALRAELAELGTRTERRAEVQEARELALQDAQKAAATLTCARRVAADALRDEVKDRLAKLAMPKAVFAVELDATALSADGADGVRLLFSANAGEAPRPVAKVASGGEASRLMLAMRAALTGNDGVECVVFDEADAGVGGAAADVVGRLIKEVSTRCQVLCITHAPQVAAHAQAHLRIEKAELRGRTRSIVRVLEVAEQRTQEVARMMSGLQVTKEALGAAEALIRAANANMKVTSSRKRNRPEKDRRTLSQRSLAG